MVVRPESGMQRRAIHFSGGGVYYHWQAGAAKCIRERLGRASHIDVTGASCGSLTAALYVSGADYDRGADLALRKAAENNLFERRNGMFKVWGNIVRHWLFELLPEDGVQDIYKNLHIQVTPLALWETPETISNLTNKGDVVDVCMASVHIPYFMDGKLSAEYKGKRYIDGDLWSLFSRRHRRPLLSERDSYIVDRRKDIDFCNKCNFAPLALISPEQLNYMMADGYSFMVNEFRVGNIRV